MEWQDKKHHNHMVASCPCWKCHVFRLAGLLSGGKLGERESRGNQLDSKLSAKLELSHPAIVAETATPLAHNSRLLILRVLLVGSFMGILVVFIVTQGLPSIINTPGSGVSL